MVAKPNLGTKRLCGDCGAKFYDLGRDPIVCPKCGTTFVEARSSAKPEAKAKPVPAKEPVEVEEVETDELDVDDAETVSLEEADEETAVIKTIPDIDDVDADDDDDESETDNTFLEDDDEDGPNLSDIVGGVKPTDDD